MKSMFENMITTIMMFLMLFVMVSIGTIELQIINARKIHSSVINQVQASYYAIDVNEINQKLKSEYPRWNIKIEELSSVNSRKDLLVTLDYEVLVPVFNIIKSGKIEGYAR